MRVAVLGDTHLPRGARTLPEDCVRRIRSADAVLHTGDHVTLSALAELEALGPPVHAVHGNVDEPALQRLLPEREVVELAGVRIGLVHDPGPRAGREQRLAALFPGCDAVAYGHTHLPQVDRHDRLWILNPGSPTERRRAPARSMLELTIRGRELRPELVVFGP